MKRSRFHSIILLLFAIGISACQTDPGTSVQPGGDPLLSRTTPNANPVFLFKGGNTVRRTVYPAIGVSDIDGSDLTYLYTSSSTSTQFFGDPCWSQTGSGTSSSPWKVSFIERDLPYTSSKLKTMNVWVSNGVATASTPTAIATMSGNTNLRMQEQQWKPGGSEIAYVARDITNHSTGGDVSEIRVIPSSGGTGTSLYSETGSQIDDIVWSPDGSRIAFRVVTLNSSGNATGVAIRIIDRAEPSGGTRMATTVCSSTNPDDIIALHWSNTSGTNLLSFSRAYYESNGAGGSLVRRQLYTVAPTSSATPQAATAGSNYIYGDGFWSPNDSQIAYQDSYTDAMKIVTLSSGSVTTLPTGSRVGNWRW